MGVCVVSSPPTDLCVFAFCERFMVTATILVLPDFLCVFVFRPSSAWIYLRFETFGIKLCCLYVRSFYRCKLVFAFPLMNNDVFPFSYIWTSFLFHVLFVPFFSFHLFSSPSSPSSRCRF